MSLHHLLSAVALAVCLLLVDEVAAARPNILFVYVDDLGWRDCGFMGSDFYETPHLDRLAAQGMVFTDAYACAANCAPSRACLLSGQYTPRHEIYNVGTRARGVAAHRRLLHVPGTDTLSHATVTWSERLQAGGYKTASIGKWHLSDNPVPHGFDFNIGGTHAGSPPQGYYPPHGKAPGLQHAAADQYLTDRLSDEAIRFIREHRDQPWALYLSHFAVHTPLQAKRELLAKYESKPPGKLHQHVTMATMVQAVDDGVGRIVQTLDELGLSDSTVIVFSSDNGGYGPATDMAPLKGYKGTYYEGGIRVPLLIKWPGTVRPGSRSAEPVSAVDLYPTLCAIAQVPIPKDQLLDGVSLVGLLSGEATSLAKRSLYWHFPAYLQSYSRTDQQRDPLFRSRPCSVIRQGDWKLHEYFEDGACELYNLRQDIGERNNLAASQPEKAEQLLSELRAWRKSTGAPVPDQLNPEFDSRAEATAIARGRERAARGP